VTANLPPRAAAVLDTINEHGTLAVDGSGPLASTVRALAKQGLVDYDRATGVVRRKTEEPVR